MALGYAGAEVGAVAIRPEQDVAEGAFAAENFESGAAGATPREHEPEARVIPKMFDGGQNGVCVMNDAEVA